MNKKNTGNRFTLSLDSPHLGKAQADAEGPDTVRMLRIIAWVIVTVVVIAAVVAIWKLVAY